MMQKKNVQTRDTHSGKEGSHISHPNRAHKLQSAQNRTTQDAILCHHQDDMFHMFGI